MVYFGIRGGRTATITTLAIGLALSPVARGEDEDVFARAPSLDRETLVMEVLRRNPSVAATLAGWRAAQARVPQERALDDPMLTYGMAPLSVAGDAPFGQSIKIEQRFPWPRKLRLAGEVAIAEAAEAKGEWRDTQLRLSVMASTLFDDWYVVHRALDVNAQHIDLVKALKRSAEAQYTVGKASQQDALQAEAELAHMEHDAEVLASQRDIVRAQINGLLHRPPQAIIPPPPARLEVSTAPPQASSDLEAAALDGRPGLAAKRAHLQGRQAAVSLARRRYYPDLGISASYNSMWMDRAHQYMIGVSINLPIYLGKRRAAVDDAQAARTRAEAELARMADEVRVEVESARRRLLEALHIHHLFETRLVPIARDRIAAARAGFQTGANGFLAVMEAERALRTINLEAETARADVDRRRAELDRVVGVMPALGDKEDRP